MKLVDIGPDKDYNCCNNIKDNIERGFIDLGLMSCPIDLSKFESVEMPLKETWGVLVKKR